MSTNVEFAVDIKDETLFSDLQKSLSSVDGIDSLKVYPKSGTIVVKSSLPISFIHEKIESTGHRAVIKGCGELEKGFSSSAGYFLPLSHSKKSLKCLENLQAAVAIIGGECGYGTNKVQGVIRFIQENDESCIIDGTVDGLTPGLHGLHVHELGDLSEGCNNVGDHFSLNKTPHGAPSDDVKRRHTGDLGNISVGSDGRSQFRFSDSVIKVCDIVGRTVVVTEKEDDLGRGNNEQSKITGNSGKRLGCGIIARSAGLFQNNKSICACDGVTLWDERNKPLAGPGRRATSESIR